MVDVDSDEAVFRFSVDAPALLDLEYSTGLKLPYIPYQKIDLDVSEQITVIGNDRLGFQDAEVGLAGSLTRVAKAEVCRHHHKDTRFVRCDDAGIEAVYDFLRARGFVR